MAEWARVANTTIAHYFKGVQDELTANQKLMALMKKAGRITTGIHGDGVKWQVPYREIPLTVNNGEQAITPTRQDYVKQPALDIAGYLVADVMTKREQLKNGSGPSQLVDYFKTMVTRSGANLKRQFGEELYVNSGAAGNTGRISGAESMFLTNGTTTITSGAQRTANALDVIGSPHGTYAGITIDLGNYGGSWTSQADISTTWPAGHGTLNYDFFSPAIVCYNSSAFSGTAQTWAQQCLTATRYGIRCMQRYDSGFTAVKKILLDGDLYRLFLDKMDSKEHAYVTNNYSLRAMGWEETFMQDGVEITWEYGIPGAVGYGFNIENMELLSWQDDLFTVRGPKFDDLNNAWHVIVDFVGQLKFQSPRKFMKLMTIAT